MRHLFCLLIVLGGLAASVQAQTTDPAKVADFQKRFQAGVELANAGKPAEALKIFDGIIAQEPRAKGSLFYAGFVCSQMGDYARAADYLKKFRAIEPQDFRGIILSIQISQALKRNVAVEALRKELYDLHSKPGTAGLSDAKMFVREKITGEKNTLAVISEYFDYRQEPYRLWQVEQLNAEGAVARHIVLSYDEDETQKLRVKEPRLTDAEMYFLGEYVLKGDVVAQINIYRQEFTKPTYEQCRQWFLDALKEPPKPIAVAPVKKVDPVPVPAK